MHMILGEKDSRRCGPELGLGEKAISRGLAETGAEKNDLEADN